MYASLLPAGWVATQDDHNREIAYTLCDGKAICAYVAGGNGLFDAWVFGEPEAPYAYPKCYQYDYKIVMAYDNFRSWFDARNWVTTIHTLIKE